MPPAKSLLSGLMRLPFKTLQIPLLETVRTFSQVLGAGVCIYISIYIYVNICTHTCTYTYITREEVVVSRLTQSKVRAPSTKCRRDESQPRGMKNARRYIYIYIYAHENIHTCIHTYIHVWMYSFVLVGTS